MTDAEYAKLHIAAVEKCLRTFGSFEGHYTDAAHTMVAKELVAHGWRECIEALRAQRALWDGEPGEVAAHILDAIERLAKERSHG